jgi:hypothetical protein
VSAWDLAPCGIHEHRTRVRACHVCAAARAETLDALSAYTRAALTQWERTLRKREQKRRAWEAKKRRAA